MCFLFHKWSKWVIIKQGKLIEDDVNIGYYTVQMTTCERCGKVKQEIIKLIPE